MRAARTWTSVVAGLTLAVTGLLPMGTAAVAADAATAPSAVSAVPAAAALTALTATPNFIDVPTSSPFYAAIMWLASSGVTTGWPDHTFRPSAPITREAMAAFLYRYAGSPAFTPPATSPFTDVATSHPFYAAITWLADQGITTGWPDHTFRPGQSITREAMSAFLYRFAGSPAFAAPATSPFTDVRTDHPFYVAITWLAHMNISTGWPDHTFRPSAPITREAMAAFLYRYDRHPDLGGNGALRASLSTAGTQGNSDSWCTSVSGDGRWIAYSSDATNLVGGDTNGVVDVFVTDRTTGVTTRVSTATGGAQANGASDCPIISADGRWIAYDSSATNLVAGDTNAQADVFVTDRTTGTTTRISTATDGTQGDAASYPASMSSDGRWIAYTSVATTLVAGDTNFRSDIFVTDRTTGVTTRASTSSAGNQVNGASYDPSISADGRWVAFESHAPNIVSGDTNASADVFVKDLSTGTITRVSTATDGTQGTADSTGAWISADGRWISYVSAAPNLVADDTNGVTDLFVTDRTTGVTTRVSKATDGTQANGESFRGSLSTDGHWVTYESAASNLVAGDTNAEDDVFVTDLTTGTTIRVAPSAGGNQVVDWMSPTISTDGAWVVFASMAGDLVAGDTNAANDVFAARNLLAPH